MREARGFSIHVSLPGFFQLDREVISQMATSIKHDFRWCIQGLTHYTGNNVL